MNHDDVPTPFFEEDGQIRYFSLARHALTEALKLAGVSHGSRVLFPAFLCRDLLAPVNLLGATPCWYDVGHDLSPVLPSEFWPIADVVLMIDYFGFPQNISIFQAYAERTGARIIEDNAHGFLSRDADGRLLGCRSDFGIFSIRKTLRIPDGAALWVQSKRNITVLPEQLPFTGAGVNPAQLKKFYIRSLPMVGEILFKALTKFIRLFRYRISSKNKSVSEPNPEICILASPEPWSELMPSLIKVDTQKEMKRRRFSYLRCSEKCEKVGGVSVFSELPPFCVPYAYAFRGDQYVVSAMQNYADQQGLDMVLWPDLPEAIVDQAPKHYRNIYLINLAW